MMNQPPSTSTKHASVEHLFKVFGECREEIIDEWRGQAAKLLSELKLDFATLTDHVPLIVDDIIDDFSSRREESSPEPMEVDGARHGIQRVLDGLDIGQVVAEFNLLRTGFFTVMDRHDLVIGGEAARILNCRIDNSVRAAVTAYAAKQAADLKAKEKEHLAFVVHDLRTPLNAIALLVEVLKQSQEDAARLDREEAFALLERNCARMTEQIKRVMEGQKGPDERDGMIQPQCRTFELWPIVQAVKVDLGAITAQAGIRVVNEVPYLLTVWADAELLATVVQNLLDNAFKHAPNGQVVIAAATEADGVICRVQDNGAGISAEMLPTVFEKDVTSSGKPGTGFGLAIVKQIVEAHSGSVWVASTPGEGTIFSFTLPAPPQS